MPRNLKSNMSQFAQEAYLFCSSSLASSSTSSGLSWAGEDGERPGEDKEVEEEVAVVCKDVGVATWLAIWLTVWDTEFFTHERVELSLPATLSVATCRRWEAWAQAFWNLSVSSKYSIKHFH